MLVTQTIFNNVKAIARNFNNGNDFVANLEITRDFEIAVPEHVVLGKLAKESFDLAFDAFRNANKAEFAKPSFKTRAGKTVEVGINYADAVVIRNGKALNCREFVVLHFKGDAKAETGAVGIYPIKAALFLLNKVVPSCKSETSLDRVLDLFTSRVIVDPSVQHVLNGGEYYGKKAVVDNIPSQQWVMEKHKISALGVCLHMNDDKAFAGLCASKLAPCKSKLGARDFAVVAEAFAKLFNEPVFCDKNNSKYLYYGDACRAAGVDLVDGEFITFNPLEVKDGVIAKPAKVFNRLASHNFLSAVVAGEMRSNLRLGLKDGGHTVSAGLPMQTLIAFSNFNNGSGVAITNGYEFDFGVPKTLTKEVNIDRFDAAFKAGFGKSEAEVINGVAKAIEKHIAAELNGNPILEGGASIEFNGVEVVKNPRFFAVTVTAVDVIPGSRTFNDKVRTVKVKLTGFAQMVKKNPKLRSMTKKLTALSKPGTIVSVVKDGGAERFDNWEIILNPECIKGSAALLEVFANDHIGHVVEWRAGVLTLDGFVVTQADLKAWVESKKQEFIIEQEVSAAFVEEYKDFSSDFEFIQKGASWLLRERCFGLVGFANFQVEVSTADENYGVSKLGVAEQYILADADERIDAKLSALCANELKDADLLGGTPTKVFKLASAADRRDLIQFLTVNQEERTKAYLGALAGKELHGIRVELTVPGERHTWVAEIPFGTLLRFGAWDEEGKALSSFAPNAWDNNSDEDVVSTNILEDCFDLFEAFSNRNLNAANLKDYFIRWGGFFGSWLNNVRSGKTIAGMVKVANTWHTKVLTDSAVGNYSRVNKGGNVIETGVPALVVDANSPLLAGNNAPGADAKLRDGDVVFIHRNPLPLFTACVVKVDNSGRFDAGMAVVNPVVWSKANLGDADGDLIYVLPARSFGVSGYQFAREYNERATAQGGHWNVFTKGDGESPVEDFVNSENLVVGSAKSVDARIDEWTLINNSVSIEELTRVAASVHEHYQFGVGKLFNIAFELTRDVCEAGSPSTAELTSILNAWVVYEEVGLGGFTVANADVVKELDEQADAVNANPIAKAPVAKANTAAAAFAAAMNAGASTGKGFDSLLVDAAARVKEAKKVVRGNVATSNRVIACAAVRNMTRKQFTDHEAAIFDLVKGNGIGGRFGAQVAAISALRAGAASKAASFFK